MRAVFMTACVVVVVVMAGQVQGVEDNHIQDGNWEEGKKILSIMNRHFDRSLKYLYTSKQYESQYLERPGMARYLQEASDDQWEEGLEALKKYMERGGTIDDFREKLEVKGQGHVNFTRLNHKGNRYARTISDLMEDSENMFKKMNQVRHRFTKENTRDAEIAHYLDEKLEKEAECTYKLKGYDAIISQMKHLGVAVKMFDSSL